MEQVIAASILFGAVLGAFTCSRLSERQGRRATILIVSGVFVVGHAALLGRPERDDAVAGPDRARLRRRRRDPDRARCTSPSSPRRSKRGRLVLTFQLGIGVGIVLATLVGASEASPWRVSVGAAAVPAAIMLVLMLRLPESPRWLVKADRRDDAREVLRGVRADGSDLDAELDEIVEPRAGGALGGPGATAAGAGCGRPWVRPALVVGLRHRHLHPAQRHRDDHLLRADDPHRQRLLRERRPAGQPRARRHLPGDDDRRAGDRRQGRPSSPDADHGARRRAGAGRARRRCSSPATAAATASRSSSPAWSSSCSSTPAACS